MENLRFQIHLKNKRVKVKFFAQINQKGFMKKKFDVVSKAHVGDFNILKIMEIIQQIIHKSEEQFYLEHSRA